MYQTPPLDHVAGPAFLNLAACVSTELDAQAFAGFLRDVERAVGRRSRGRLEARLIDVDVIFPHERLAERPYDLVPLAEIAPELVDAATGKTVRELTQLADTRGITRKERAVHFLANRQEEHPEIRLAINRVGVSRVKRIVRLKIDEREMPVLGEFAMLADLAPDKAGVHMSRFSELLEEATLEVLSREERPGDIRELVTRIAREIVDSQQALRAEVRLRAEFGLERWTPVSGKRGEETYTLLGIAHADRAGARALIGVEAEGMTACPCAQLMVREHSLHELTEAGFSPSDAERALDALPVATHNQRGRGGVLIGVPEGEEASLRADDLVELVENAMSSETYDLLKRPDEFFIVNKAHQNPRFVEDVVRGILDGALDIYADLSDRAFISASQVNYESIHKHDACAEAYGTFGELREELASGRHIMPKMEMSAWLMGRN